MHKDCQFHIFTKKKPVLTGNMEVVNFVFFTVSPRPEIGSTDRNTARTTHVPPADFLIIWSKTPPPPKKKRATVPR